LDVRYKPLGIDQLSPIPKHETDAERQLKWMRSQVSPVLMHLLEWYSREDLISWLFDRSDMPEVKLLEELPWHSDVGDRE